ncbi:hypothetical protein EJB05_12047, partial [Eragrostis curvula]
MVAAQRAPPPPLLSSDAGPRQRASPYFMGFGSDLLPLPRVRRSAAIRPPPAPSGARGRGSKLASSSPSGARVGSGVGSFSLWRAGQRRERSSSPPSGKRGISGSPPASGRKWWWRKLYGSGEIDCSPPNRGLLDGDAVYSAFFRFAGCGHAVLAVKRLNPTCRFVASARLLPCQLVYGHRHISSRIAMAYPVCSSDNSDCYFPHD